MKELIYPYNTDLILRKKGKIIKELQKKNDLREIKIAILSGSTVGEIKDIIEIFLLDKNIKPIFFEGNYNRFYEDAVFDNEKLIAFNPNFIYIHTSVKNIKRFPLAGDDVKTVENIAEETYSLFEQVWEKLKILKCPIIQNNFEFLPYRVNGNGDAYLLSGAVSFINRINEMFCKYARENNCFYLNDLNYQASWFGIEKWHDYTMWYMFKYPFSMDAFPLVANNIANIIKSAMGLNKKAIICDLDNTLWGGTVGDDGKDGIRIGWESPEGMMYADFQAYLKQLSARGIPLNVCSKNNEDTAYSGFDNEGNILSKDDFAIFKANWENKDKNIADIIHELNILDESVVFLDDNAAEREIVNNAMPKVESIQLSADINYVTVLDQQGYFELTNLSDDDKKRSEYYKDNVKRIQEMNTYTDYSEYLSNLKMIATIETIGHGNIERNLQLINKTNQFNLTTKRLTMVQLTVYMNTSNRIGYCARLRDKYGDNGIVSTLLATINNGKIDIELWIMSCRVFKRDLEKVILDELVKQCKTRNISIIRGYYEKTEKNSYVENLYPSLGFKEIKKYDNSSIWEYYITPEYKYKNKVVEVRYE